MKIEIASFITNKLNVVNIDIIKMMLAYDNLMEDNCLYWKNVTVKNILIVYNKNMVLKQI